MDRLTCMPLFRAFNQDEEKWNEYLAPFKAHMAAHQHPDPQADRPGSWMAGVPRRPRPRSRRRCRSLPRWKSTQLTGLVQPTLRLFLAGTPLLPLPLGHLRRRQRLRRRPRAPRRVKCWVHRGCCALRPWGHFGWFRLQCRANARTWKSMPPSLALLAPRRLTVATSPFDVRPWQHLTSSWPFKGGGMLYPRTQLNSTRAPCHRIACHSFLSQPPTAHGVAANQRRRAIAELGPTAPSGYTI
ncbi:uncharacterized protein LOC126482353 [Schistocerca serialis cubense]|uniref:uncharacterized protein LOC126482353 n=1 Tax=Schistocerca serialis cubense TaxID=2023355 RepID=UPI00214E4197|nr:uncharacterized protein LOC126482353 [Schistocerca serialis cubense]